MGMEVTVIKRGAIYDRVRRSARGDDPDGMIEFCRGLADNWTPEFILDQLEPRLIEVVREEQGEIRSRARGHERRPADRPGGPEPTVGGVGGHVELVYPDAYEVVFTGKPTERGALARRLLTRIHMLRHSLQRRELENVFVSAFWLGRAYEQLEVLPLEPDVARGKKSLANAVEAGRARGRANADRDRKIREAYLAMRRDRPEARDLDLRKDLAREHGVSPERIRQIVREQALQNLHRS